MIVYNPEFILALAAKATVILAAGVLLTIVLRQSAAARYLTWICVFIAILALPLLSLQSWSIPVEVVHATPLTTFVSSETQILTPDVPQFPWLRYAATLWLCGLAFFLMRIVAGHLKVRAMVRRSTKVADPAWLQSLEQIRANTRVNLLSSVETDVPLSYGFVNPSIVLNENCDGWTAERRSAVLIHELTHIRRRDTLLTVIAQLATAVYWVHPLAWLALSRFRKEQECSCDDAVLRAGVAQADYADHLIGVARTTAWPAASAMAGTNHLEARIRALLDPSKRRLALTPRMCAIAAVVAAAIIVPLAAVRAQDGSAASLTGSVYDASGAAIPNAQVNLKTESGQLQDTTKTGPAGSYSFPHVRPGRYHVEVRSPGFAALTTPVALDPGASVHLDPKLDIGQTMETVEVVGRGTPTAAPPGPPQRIRVGGNVQAMKLLKKVNPEYPANAQSAGITGTVMLRAVISTTGDLLNLSVVNTPDSSLAQAATEAVSKWKYQPTLLNGEPVEVVTTVAVNFKLQP